GGVRHVPGPQRHRAAARTDRRAVHSRPRREPAGRSAPGLSGRPRAWAVRPRGSAHWSAALRFGDSVASRFRPNSCCRGGFGKGRRPRPLTRREVMLWLLGRAALLLLLGGHLLRWW